MQTKQEEKALVESGSVDLARLAVEAEKILKWCRTVKEARGELSYQQKRDFLRILGIKVFISKSDKRRKDEHFIWKMEADLPEIRDLNMSNTYQKGHRQGASSVAHMSTCYP